MLGIGINVQPSSFPPELADRASSLETELGRPVDRGMILARVLASLAEVLSLLESGPPARLLDRWQRLAPSAVGAAIEWDEGELTRRGVTAGLAADGALIARDGDDLHRIIAGEVRWK